MPHTPHTTVDPIFWVGFTLVIVFLLLIDLGVFNKKAHTVKTKEALGWYLVWVTLAAIFNIGIYRFLGSQRALEFLTGYLIEQALVRRQHLRLPRHLSVLRGAAHAPARRSLLGHPRGDHHAHRVHPRRRGAPSCVPLDDLRDGRVPHLHRVQADPARRSRRRSGEEPPRTNRPTDLPRRVRVPRAELLRARGRAALRDAAFPGAGRGRSHRRGRSRSTRSRRSSR